MNVNPLMTVWLISCVVTFSSFAGANRYSSFKYEKKNGISDLARLYGKGGDLSSYRLNVLKLLTAQKKKKTKNSDTKTSTEASDECVASTTTIDPLCISSTTHKHKKSSKTTADPCAYLLSSKNTKSTKKAKTRSTTISQQGSDGGDKNNTNDNVINSGGSNKWKKIQKFFFGPPSWSFSKSYKAYGPTTNDGKPLGKERSTVGKYNPTTLKSSCSDFLYPIPGMTNDQYDDKLLVKEEIVKKNMSGGLTIIPKGQMNNLEIPNNPYKQVSNEIEKNPPQKFGENDAVSYDPISQDEKSFSRIQDNRYDITSYNYGITSSYGLIDKTYERTQPEHLGQQEPIISRPWLQKHEEITPRQDLSVADKMLYTEEVRMLPQDHSSEPKKEETDIQYNYQTNVLFYDYVNNPSTHQVENRENINYNNIGTLNNDFLQTPITIDINESIDQRQFQLKPEGITENIKEKYEVSMVREDPEFFSKPEATIELDKSLNQTSMKQSDLSYKRNQGVTGDKWNHIFNFDMPNYEKIKNVYPNIINQQVTENDLFTSKIENALDKIMKPNFNNLHNIDYENNVTDNPNMFYRELGNFLNKDTLQNFPLQSSENLYTTKSPPLDDLDNDHLSDLRAKQLYFVNIETKLPTVQPKNSSNAFDELKFTTPNFETTLHAKPTRLNLKMVELNSMLKDDSLSEKKLLETTITTTTTVASTSTTTTGTTTTSTTTESTTTESTTTASTTPSSTIMEQYSIDMWPKYSERTDNNLDYMNFLYTQSPVLIPSSTELFEASSSNNHDEPRVEYRMSYETTYGLEKPNEPIELPKDGKRFEAFITFPLSFTDNELEIKSFRPATEVTTTKHMGRQSLLNLTLHPMLFDNLWGIQSYLNSSSHIIQSTTPNSFPDDKIAFENQHEFNSDHHFQSTSQPFFSDTSSSEWAPFNIPDMENVEIATTSKINDVTKDNIEQIKDFSNFNVIMNGMLNRKEMSHTKDLKQPEELPNRNPIEKTFLDHNFFPFPQGAATNNGRNDIAKLVVDPFFKNIKKNEFMGRRMDDRNSDNLVFFETGINEIATQAMNTGSKIGNKIDFWRNLYIPSSNETEGFKEITNAYKKGKTEVDEFNKNSTSFHRINVGRIDDGQVYTLSIPNYEILTNNLPNSSFSHENQPTSSNNWYARNEQNEKMLASEKSFSRPLSMSSPSSRGVNFDYLKNNIGYINNILNQSSPEVTNNSDANKNEFSAIEMSAIKVFKKKPDKFLQPSDTFLNLFNENDNNSEINHAMSQMFLKMQDFANKLGMKKFLLKRGITDLKNYPIETNGPWKNKNLGLGYKTRSIPFDESDHTDDFISAFKNDKNQIKSKIGRKLINDKWKYKMQSIIDKGSSEMRDLHDNDNQQNPVHQGLSKENSEDNDVQFFNNNTGLIRNVVGNKKMKSRELEFILDRNLPRLPLNKRQFITYMMTGLKNSGNPISDDERYSQLSKSNLQNLIDRNVKKDKVMELNKRPRKKHWHTNTFL